MQLVRSNIQSLIDLKNIDSTHAGLLTQKTLPEWEEGEKPKKTDLIKKISSVKPDKVYELAFKRWLLLTNDEQNTQFVNTTATIEGRLMTGLPLGGTLETGVSTHHSYGMPMLAGSSIKGAVRHFAQSIGIEQKVMDVLFGKDTDNDDSDAGDNDGANAGYLIWHDAWWIPDTTTDRPFCQDIVTVHHQKYYAGEKTQADDTESPTPNLQIAVQGSFYFVIEGVYAWANYAKALLERMLQEQGLGAKTASGYGYFRLDNAVISGHIEQMQKDKDLKQQEDEINKASSELEKELIQQINDEQWRISKDEAKTNFTQAIEIWLDKLEQQPDKGCTDLLIEIANIHYSKQMKNPKKAKENQRRWIERLLNLSNP